MKTDLTENKSTESGKSPISMALKEWYYGDLWEKILDDWLKKNNNNANQIREFYNKPQEWQPWFGKISSELHSVLGKADESVRGYFPNSIRSGEQAKVIDVDLDYLMPENNPQVADVLPVLTTCYCYNYNQPYKTKKGGKERENYSFAQCLYSGGFYEKQELEKKIERYQSILNMEKEYSKLAQKADKISLTNLQRVLPAYARAVAFLVFLINMPCCNPALSFYIFECMTGYLGLFGDKARACIDRFDQRDIENIFSHSTNENDEVIKFAEEIIDDFQRIKVRRSEKYAGSQDKEDLPLSLCYFVANFQRVLSPDAQDKKGQLPVLCALSGKTHITGEWADEFEEIRNIWG